MSDLARIPMGDKPEVCYDCDHCQDSGWIWLIDDSVRKCPDCRPRERSGPPIEARTFR